MDKLKINIAFPSDPQNIRNIKLMLFYNYGLTDKVKLNMHTMSVIDIDTPVGASYIKLNGQINLNQKAPISSGTIAKTLGYTNMLTNMTSPVDFVTLYKDYSDRNLTTTISYDKIVMPYRSDKETVIEMEISIPAYQNVMYVCYNIDMYLLSYWC